MSSISASRLTLLSWLVLIGGLVLTPLAALTLAKNEENRAMTEFADRADRIALRVRERLSGYDVVLDSGAALFNASDLVTEQDWRRFAERLQPNPALDGMETLGFARFVREQERHDHGAWLEQHHIRAPIISPPGEREAYGYVLYTEHLSGTGHLSLGLDLLTKPALGAAMTRAEQTGKTSLSAKAGLSAPADSGATVMMFAPVYRQSRLLGWVFGSLRSGELVKDMVAEEMHRQAPWTTLRLYDGNTPSANALLYHHGDGQGLATPFLQQRVIDVNGRQWLLVSDHANPAAVIDHRPALLVLISGLILSVLLFLLLRSALASRARAEALAEQLSGELSLREHRYSRLQSRLNRIASRVSGMLFEYRLETNGRGTFPYASDGIRQLFGLPPEQARDNAAAMFDAIHPDDVDEVAEAILNSASTLNPWHHEFRVNGPDNQPRWLLGDALPRRETDGATSWFGVITDITGRKQAEQALKAAHSQSRHFRAALDQVSSFIYMKDTRFRYIYANRAALEQFGCNSITLKGCMDEQFFARETAQVLRESDNRVLAGEPCSEEVEIIGKDGRRTVFLDVKTPIFDDPEHREIVGLLGIRTDITLLKDSEQQLRQLAHFDPLTRLHNRVLLSDRLRQAMAQARRHQQAVAVVYLDLDGFKAINDTHGHAAGDKLLVAVAGRMKEVIREGDTLARVGGDEFVAILLDLADPHHCTPLLDRLLQAAARPVNLDGLRLQVSASLGVTFYPQAEELDPDQLLRQADQSMYQAKLAGKNRYHLFDTERDRSVRTHHESLEHIRHALHNGEFVLYYQPKVNMRTGQVIGAEALIRWQHPQQGLLPPSHFLPAIEEHALAIELGNWVIDAALQQIREWQAQGLKLVVSVNLSARQLRQEAFVAQLTQLLGHYPDIDPAWLELEILETSALGDLAQISERLCQCRKLGLGISLDDFGTGYSSLTYLKQLPAGIVKVDQSFVRDILEDPEDLTILDGVLSLARAFGRTVIAEGVETVEHGNMLLRIGCELAQGYGIARPMPAAELPGWVAGWKPASHWAGLPRVDPALLPLLYASIEHRAWIDSIDRALHQPDSPWPALEAEHCRFGIWYRHCAAPEQRRLAPLAGLHQQLHEQAAQLQQWQCDGQGQAARQGLAELRALHRRLADELERALTPPARPTRPILKSV
ncbi:diguanylate cyclase/phosphodiesterase with PAS/PAC and Chase sensor(s) [Oceanimonas sp. GK1]|uniref:EAL domain-containing protein n=1 Tax=Oceanimonas sp. (strain GK1 / IBRC-M 10197) TaxID=511062 RepID=UPI000249521A|nr:EAL domain-containing protein [Oceanimonas sp. GK1]AEY01394.1 diguanylate cyclase/phosphodiesterase with PAS/PAC and Chase sensor(s) [Oceanimonas sp. GK1]